VANGPELLRLASREPRAYSAVEAVALIHGAGGIASLAHPIKVRPVGAVREPSAREGAVHKPPLQADDVRPLVAAGLDGLEVWQIVHDESARRHFTAVAEALGLLRVGGSDCHGPRRSAGPRIGSQRVPYGVFEDLTRAIAARQAGQPDPA
jgi:predicted metal-dependent phosphoesterase TrpH